MPDFSDRYKKALESREISPDFKERTALLMAELRDSEELVPKTAEDEPAAASFTLSESREKYSRRSSFIKMISAAAAAAACLTVGIALDRAGVFDRSNEPAVISSRSVMTEATDSMESLAEQPVTDSSREIYTASESRDIIIHGTENDSDSGQDEAVCSGVPLASETEMTAQTEETITSAMTRAVTSEETVSVMETVPETEAASDTEAIAPSDTVQEAENPAAENENASPTNGIVGAPADGEVILEAPPLPENGVTAESVLELSPFYDDDIPALGYEEEAGEEVDYEEEIEEAPEENTASSDMSAASGFSPRRAVAGFPSQTSNALITPSFEDTISEDGTVVKYQPKRIRSVTKLLELNKELYSCTEEDSAAFGSEAPSDSRYIIDYTEDDGNAMRIYIGSRYICFAYNGGFYTYELTEEEFKELDGFLFGLVS